MNLMIGECKIPGELPWIPRMDRVLSAHRRAMGLQHAEDGTILLDPNGSPVWNKADPDTLAVVVAAAVGLCWRGDSLGLPPFHEAASVESWGNLALGALIRHGHSPSEIYECGRGLIDLFYSSMPHAPKSEAIEEHADFSEAAADNGPSPDSASATGTTAIPFDGSI